MSASVRSKCVGSRARLIFSVMVVTVLSALVLVGCGKDDDTPPDDIVIDGGGDDGSGGGGGGDGDGNGGGGGNPVDPNNPNNGGGGDDSYTYSGGTVKIGGKTWMAKNLDRATANSKCYDNNPANCAKYGRLYNWEDAMKACPAGWHLPSDAEWTVLTDAVGGSSTAGTKLKSTSGWYNNGNGTDDYGFAALPGGYGSSDGSFNEAEQIGLWWGSTAAVGTASYAWRCRMGYSGENVSRDATVKTGLFSVRCVQD